MQSPMVFHGTSCPQPLEVQMNLSLYPSIHPSASRTCRSLHPYLLTYLLSLIHPPTVTYLSRSITCLSFIHIYLPISLCIYVCIYVCMHVSIYLCMYLSICVCIYVCMHVSIYVSIKPLHIDTHGCVQCNLQVTFTAKANEENHDGRYFQTGIAKQTSLACKQKPNTLHNGKNHCD